VRTNFLPSDRYFSRAEHRCGHPIAPAQGVVSIRHFFRERCCDCVFTTATRRSNSTLALGRIFATVASSLHRQRSLGSLRAIVYCSGLEIWARVYAIGACCTTFSGVGVCYFTDLHTGSLASRRNSSKSVQQHNRD
jgi:hypothetical protein